MKIYGEREINLFKLIDFIKKRWRFIIICMLLGSFGLCAIKGLHQKKNDDEKKIYNEQELEEILSDVEKRNVEYALMYNKQLEEENKYFEESLYLSKDGYNLRKTVLKFRVDCEEVGNNTENLQKIRDIIEVYRSYIGSDEFKRYIIEHTNVNIEEKYIDELILFDELEQVQIDANFTICLINDNKIDGFEQLVEDFLQSKVEVVREKIGMHNLELFQKNTQIMVDRNLISNQQSVLNNIYNIDAKLTSLVAAFSENQKSYYNIRAGFNNEEKAEESGQNLKTLVLVAVIGAVMGIAVSIFVILIYYMVDGKVMSYLDYESILGLKYLGKVSTEDSKEKNQKCNDFFSDGDSLFMKMKHICEAENVTSVVFTSSETDLLGNRSVKQLLDKLSNIGIHYLTLDDAFSNNKSADQLFEMKNCILIEQEEKSSINNLKWIVNFCEENNVKIVGVVETRE